MGQGTGSPGKARAVALAFLVPSADRYRRRETRRAVRRPVRRATLRDPNIVNLLLLRSVTVPGAYRA
jgi:hypothetical protein